MSTPAANLKINSSRLWDSLMEMAKIGPGVAGGNNRQTLTDEDAEGRELFQKCVIKKIWKWVLTKWEQCSQDVMEQIQMLYLSTLEAILILSRLGVSMMEF